MVEGQVQIEPQPCGARVRADGSIYWRAWAPRARSLELVIVARADHKERCIEMQRQTGGYFTHVEPRLPEGQRYAFRIDGGPERPDPASQWQPDGIHRHSAIVSLDRFEWSDRHWRGLPREQFVIYELHVGTFTAEGTFDAIIPRLELLREFGITAIELMPVGQFPGSRGWGYDGVHPYAVHESYGGPRGLQRLVDACHRIGLALILDVVYNHLGPEGNYLAEFGPYFTNRYRTPWGLAMNFDDRGSDAVRTFVLDNVRQWIRDFHVDGLRLDAVHAIYDCSPKNILREIQEVVDGEARRSGNKRQLHVFAESNLNDVRLLDPPDCGGCGLDAQWSDDFHHAVHALLTGERARYYVDFGQPDQLVKAINQTFVYDGCYSQYRDRRHGAPVRGHASDRFVVAIQNHDQVGNRPSGDRLSTLLDPARLRLAAGLLLFSPHIPLIFMGEEYGETRPFPFFCSFEDPEIAEAARRGRLEELETFGWEGDAPDPQSPATFDSAKLQWSWPNGSSHAGLRELYYDLLAIRRYWLPLAESREYYALLLDNETNQAGAAEPANPMTSRTTERSDSARGDVLRLTRRASAGDRTFEMIGYFNLSAVHQPVPERDYAGFRLILSSESPRFGGSRAADEPPLTLAPFEFWLFAPKSWVKP